MTLQEIIRTPATDLSQTAWLREICIQLAMLNEKRNQQSQQGNRR
jgi:hypothetical protein